MPGTLNPLQKYRQGFAATFVPRTNHLVEFWVDCGQPPQPPVYQPVSLPETTKNIY